MVQFSQEKQSVNTKQKDRLFKIIFGRQENREWTLSLYNAINGTNYDNPDDIVITTIENAVYMGMANDVSFLIEDTMNLYEHQSTLNPNMPIRMFIYAGQIYSKYIQDRRNRIDIYRRGQQRIPVPKLICFYNGEVDAPDSKVMSLRDAFNEPEKTDIDVRVTMLNINHGHNKKLMESCKALRDYSEYVETWRKALRETGNNEEAANIAIESLPDDSPIKPYLIKHKAEVMMSIITEYDEAWTLQLIREDAIEEGRNDGLTSAIGRLLKKYSPEEILDMGFTAEEIKLAQEQI